MCCSLEISKGAEAIEKMAESSRKRAKVAEELLKIDKQKSLMALFSMEGTDPSMKKQFLELAQQNALKELDAISGKHEAPAAGRSDSSQTQSNFADNANEITTSGATQDRADPSSSTPCDIFNLIS